MFLKKFTVAVLSGLMLVSLSACGKGPEGVAAKVNDVEIPMEDFYKSYAIRRNQYVANAGGDESVLEGPIDPTGKQSKLTVDQYLKDITIKDLTETEIIKQDAAANNIKVEDSEIQKILDQYKAQLGGDEQFKAYLDSLGIPLDYLKEVLKNQTLVGKYTQEKYKNIKVTDDDVKKYYDEHKDDFFKAKASHILVDDLKKANEIKKEIDKGAKFEEMAKKESKDTGSATNGGDLGEFTNGQMVQSFNDAIKKMEKGEISDPIKSDFGFHIIKLKEKKPRTFDEVKDEIKSKLTQEKYEKAIKEVVSKAKVKKYVKAEDEIKIPDEFKNYGKVKQDATKENSQASEGANKETNAQEKNAEKNQNKGNNKASQEKKSK